MHVALAVYRVPPIRLLDALYHFRSALALSDFGPLRGNFGRRLTAADGRFRHATA